MTDSDSYPDGFLIGMPEQVLDDQGSSTWVQQYVPVAAAPDQQPTHVNVSANHIANHDISH